MNRAPEYALLLGAKGFVARHLRRPLSQLGFHVIGASREPRMFPMDVGFDAADTSWWEPDRWTSCLLERGIDPIDIGLIVNLVVAKHGQVQEVTRINEYGVRCLRALREVTQYTGSRTLCVHIASMAEVRNDTSPDPYSRGKIAARNLCVRLCAADLILTLGIVRRAPVNFSGTEARLRQCLTFLPQLRSRVYINVSTPAEIGRALAAARLHHYLLTNHDTVTQRSYVLIGSDIALAEYFELPKGSHGFQFLEKTTWRLLERTGEAFGTLGIRLAGFARSALSSDAEEVYYREGYSRHSVLSGTHRTESWPDGFAIVHNELPLGIPLFQKETPHE